MVRRRSTVRFRKGAPVQEINSNILNFLGSHSGSQVVRTSGKISASPLQDIQHGGEAADRRGENCLPFLR
jgi:hypothetical protein